MAWRIWRKIQFSFSFSFSVGRGAAMPFIPRLCFFGRCLLCWPRATRTTRHEASCSSSSRCCCVFPGFGGRTLFFPLLRAFEIEATTKGPLLGFLTSSSNIYDYLKRCLPEVLVPRLDLHSTYILSTYCDATAPFRFQ